MFRVTESGLYYAERIRVKESRQNDGHIFRTSEFWEN